MTTRRLNDPAVQAEVTAEYRGLPHLSITDRAGEAHVITTGLRDLERWLLALGGTLHRETSHDHAALWTLHTSVPDHGPQVVVHALTLDTDQIDPAYAHLVHDATPHPPAV